MAHKAGAGIDKSTRGVSNSFDEVHASFSFAGLARPKIDLYGLSEIRTGQTRRPGLGINALATQGDFPGLAMAEQVKTNA